MLPLKTDENNQILPVKNKNTRKICSPEELIFFFKNCFSPREKKFKMILLLQLGCECRIREACAVNLDDFVEGSNYRELDMLIQKKVKKLTKDGKIKYVGENEIERKYLPESIAAHIREWISDNKFWIYEFEGYIFPPSKMQKKGIFTNPKVVETWFCNKRKQLAEQFPERNFLETIGKRIYKDISTQKFKKNTVENKYLWRTHMMKAFAGTYAYLFTQDAVFTQQLLCHKSLKTTQKHYIDGATIAPPERKIKVKNTIFDVNFYDQIKRENEEIPAVWEQIKRKF